MSINRQKSKLESADLSESKVNSDADNDDIDEKTEFMAGTIGAVKKFTKIMQTLVDESSLNVSRHCWILGEMNISGLKSFNDNYSHKTANLAINNLKSSIVEFCKQDSTRSNVSI